MKWLSELFRGKSPGDDKVLQAIRDKFSHFRAILDSNNTVLRVISDMEEKSQGEYLFDINYIKSCLGEIRPEVKLIVDCMVKLGGEKYEILNEQFETIDADITAVMPGDQRVEEDDYIIPFSSIDRRRIRSVGGKNAQLGEMKTVLGLPVPDGFAISSWAYKKFFDHTGLQDRVNESFASVDLKSYQDLVYVSDQIRSSITTSPLPADLEEAIIVGLRDLQKRTGASGFAVRSSAIGEDSLLSFAGQYETYLNVQADQLLNCYRKVVASKFSPQAIYYYLSHSISESELAMSVGCVEMVDPFVSGVVYTSNPINPSDDTIIINSAFGLGEYLVSGNLNPDTFTVAKNDLKIIESRISDKSVKLGLQSDGGTAEASVPEAERNLPSLREGQIRDIAEIALKLEKNYGTPQDVEWAIDHSGRLFLLQTRPLQMVGGGCTSIEFDVSSLEVIMRGGTTICPGGGGGKVVHVHSPDDLNAVPEGAVVVAPGSFPGLITVMSKVNAIITETGGIASHMATIAREYRLPAVAGLTGAAQLPGGREVTVDACKCVIYDGIHEQLIEARRPEFELFEDMPIFELLEAVLKRVSPLNLLNPSDPDFRPENCRTIHDITRFSHQRSMDEMFQGIQRLVGSKKTGLKLQSAIPLQVNLIFVDDNFARFRKRVSIRESEIPSIPMKAFWKGVVAQGWPSIMPPASIKGFAGVLATEATRSGTQRFRENSYVVMSREYMVASFYLGYHLTTIESICSEKASNNFIRMQYKEGGASLDRRVRRIRLLADILSLAGFEHHSKGDYFYTMTAYHDRETIEERLHLLGRLTMMSKQLDMALTNDDVARWYTDDFIIKLGLKRKSS